MPERPPKGPDRQSSPTPQSGRSQPPVPGSRDEIKTRLDGQRGWLNELDRSLRRRSLIALILTCLAIGAGAAAIYVSVTKNSDSDRLDALETRIGNLEQAAGTVTDPETGLPEGTTLPGTGTTLPGVPTTGASGASGTTDSGVLQPTTP